MKSFPIIPALAVLIALAIPLSAHAASPCEAFVHTMTQQALDIFHDKAADENKKKAELGALFENAVDTDWVGKFVLGQYWKTATDQQRQEYLALYKNYVTGVYISKFNAETAADIKDIQIVSFKPSGDGQFDVDTTIKKSSGENNDTDVLYRLQQKGNQCQVHDIIIENISLLSTHRSEFKAAGDAGGIDRIIADMKKQLASTD